MICSSLQLQHVGILRQEKLKTWCDLINWMKRFCDGNGGIVISFHLLIVLHVMLEFLIDKMIRLTKRNIELCLITSKLVESTNRAMYGYEVSESGTCRLLSSHHVCFNAELKCERIRRIASWNVFSFRSNATASHLISNEDLLKMGSKTSEPSVVMVTKCNEKVEMLWTSNLASKHLNYCLFTQNYCDFGALPKRSRIIYL